MPPDPTWKVSEREMALAWGTFPPHAEITLAWGAGRLPNPRGFTFSQIPDV